MSHKSAFNPVFIFAIFFSALLLSYTGYRSYILSFTHDESVTYLNIIHGTFYQIISNDSVFVSANNHILNSLCMKYFEPIFGSSEFALRIQSLMAHILYMLFTYLLLVKNIQSKWIQIVGFIFLNLNPYLLDFFSLARGYALAIAFMVASLYYFIEYTKKETFKYMALCLATALLSTLSNFSMITFTASIILLIEYFIVIKRYSIKQYIRQNIPILITCICLFCLYLWPISRLVTAKELYFGGKDGLWNDTVLSSILFYLHYIDYADVSVLFFKILLLFVIFASSFLLVKKIKQNDVKNLDYSFVIGVLIVSMHFAQHYIMNTNFYIERVALFLVILFFLVFLHTIDQAWKHHLILKIISYILVLSTFSIMTLVCMECLNTSYVYNWKFDSKTKEILDEISIDKMTKPNVNIGTTWLYEPTLNFYKITKSLNWLEPIKKNSLADTCNYYYVGHDDFNLFDKTNKEIIKTYTLSSTFLFKGTN